MDGKNQVFFSQYDYYILPIIERVKNVFHADRTTSITICNIIN